MKENQANHPLLDLKSPWVNNDNPIWLASTINLWRNVEKFKFPSKLTTDRRKQIVSLISKELTGANVLNGPELYRAEETAPLDKEFLVEHFLTAETFQQAHIGEAFVIDKTGGFFASLNIKDHIHLQIIDTRGELETTWNKLVKLETTLGKAISYSYSSLFGFLTADPTECGTGFVLQVYLQLSALIHTGKLESVLKSQTDDSIRISGLMGTPSELIGDLVLVRNNYTLGVNEETILSSVRGYTAKLLLAEKNQRDQLKLEESADVKDKVSRAYAILIHSYQIEAIEALNAISLLKLGTDLGWVSGMKMSALNELFFNCRRAHLLRQFSGKVEQEQIPHKRAEFIHKALKNVSLLI